MFPRIDSWCKFKIQVQRICELIIKSCTEPNAIDFTLISIDEKPGIQALARKEVLMQLGKPRRRDIEYVRNGKTCLIAGLEVGSGKLVSNYYTDRNDEAAFLAVIKQTVKKYKADKKIIFLADNLATHSTVSLVEYIASQIGYTESLGKNRRVGILKNQNTRKTFLADPAHRISFQYTPKHCSWLNPIENWFSVLQRRVIRGGSFTTVDQLKDKIDQYIDYHNTCLFKPIKWQFTGFTKSKSIAA